MKLSDEYRNAMKFWAGLAVGLLISLLIGLGMSSVKQQESVDDKEDDLHITDAVAVVETETEEVIKENVETPTESETEGLYKLEMDDELGLYVEGPCGCKESPYITKCNRDASDETSQIRSNVLIAVYGRSFNGITLGEFEMIAERVFTLSGDLSFETQVVVASVIFNRLESPNYPDTVEEVLDDMVADKPFPHMAFMGGASCWYPDAMDSVNEAVQTVINNDLEIPSVPFNVTGISNEYWGVDEESGEVEWTSDCIEGLLFYTEEE